MTDDEPTANISGGVGGGGEFAAFEPGDAETEAEEVVDRLGALFWRKIYGGQDAFTCLVRTILSQNTSDVASQPAHDALIERYGDGDEGRSDDAGGGDLAESLARAHHAELAETIRPAGLYNQKATVIIDAAEDVLADYGSAAGFDDFVKAEAPTVVRDALLEMKGVGPKTADCVLLFAGGRTGVFPVDTHVHRIFRRLGVAAPNADHEGVREVLERDVPAEKCGFGHTASIQFGREYCTARRPVCLDGPEECPLFDLCDRVGVDLKTGAVVDPSKATVEK